MRRPRCCSTGTASSPAGAVVGEGTVGGFAGVYRVLSALEETGRIRRGYFVEGLGAAQFASPARSTGCARSPRARTRTTRPVAAWCWPRPIRPIRTVRPCPGRAGAAMAPMEQRHRPARRAGALVVLVDGRGGAVRRTGRPITAVLHHDPEPLAAAAAVLAELVQRGRLGGLTVTRMDGAET